MKEFDKFKQSYDAAIETIKSFMEPSHPEDPANGMTGLTKWLLTTDVNPYAYLPERLATAIGTAEGFSAVLRKLHHDLYDDGDVTFVTVNGQPRIVFESKNEDDFYRKALQPIERDMLDNDGTKYVVKVLDITPNEFGPTYDEWNYKDTKRCFMWDAGCGIEWAANQYRQYQCWDESWIDEAKVKYEK